MAARSDSDRSVLRDGRVPEYRMALLVHVPLALLAVGMLAAGRYLPPRLLPLRPCTFLRVTGYPCPFCGYTRAFLLLCRGAWREALAGCPLALPVFSALLLFLAWNLYALASGHPWPFAGLPGRMSRRRRKLALSVVLAALLANWLYRLALGLK